MLSIAVRELSGEACAMPNHHRDRAISLPFSDAVTVLMEACRVRPEGRTAFEARIRHLQRLGVPGRGPGQSRGRLHYGIAELAALATAIRLMTAFMAPTLAARYVVERWAELAPFALAGAERALPVDYLARRPIRNGPIAVFEGNALADLGQKGRHEARYLGPLGAVTIIGDSSGDVSSAADGAGLILDSRIYMPGVVAGSVARSMATGAELAVELDRLRFT